MQQTIKSLEKANEDLKANDKLQKDFINISAHELRTPIQAVVRFTEIALKEREYKKTGGGEEEEDFETLKSRYYKYMQQ